jgi:hypothetical protein
MEVALPNPPVVGARKPMPKLRWTWLNIMVVIKDQPGDDVNLQTFQKSSLPRTVPVCPRTWAGQVEVESNVSRPHPVV